MSKCIQIRSLAGWSGKVVLGDSDETVADLRRKVAALNPGPSSFKLFCKGVPVTDNTPLSSLSLAATEFLTLIPLASAKDRAARGAVTATATATRTLDTNAANAAATSSAAAAAAAPLSAAASSGRRIQQPAPTSFLTTDQPVPYSSEGLITLLPGYESRPNRTPTKPRSAAACPPLTQAPLPLLPALRPLLPAPQALAPLPLPPVHDAAPAIIGEAAAVEAPVTTSRLRPAAPIAPAPAFRAAWPPAGEGTAPSSAAQGPLVSLGRPLGPQTPSEGGSASVALARAAAAAVTEPSARPEGTTGRAEGTMGLAEGTTGRAELWSAAGALGRPGGHGGELRDAAAQGSPGRRSSIKLESNGITGKLGPAHDCIGPESGAAAAAAAAAVAVAAAVAAAAASRSPTADLQARTELVPTGPGTADQALVPSPPPPSTAAAAGQATNCLTGNCSGSGRAGPPQLCSSWGRVPASGGGEDHAADMTGRWPGPGPGPGIATGAGPKAEAEVRPLGASVLVVGDTGVGHGAVPLGAAAGIQDLFAELKAELEATPLLREADTRGGTVAGGGGGDAASGLGLGLCGAAASGRVGQWRGDATERPLEAAAAAMAVGPLEVESSRPDGREGSREGVVVAAAAGGGCGAEPPAGNKRPRRAAAAAAAAAIAAAASASTASAARAGSSGRGGGGRALRGDTVRDATVSEAGGPGKGALRPGKEAAVAPPPPTDARGRLRVLASGCEARDAAPEIGGDVIGGVAGDEGVGGRAERRRATKRRRRDGAAQGPDAAASTATVGAATVGAATVGAATVGAATVGAAKRRRKAGGGAGKDTREVADLVGCGGEEDPAADGGGAADFGPDDRNGAPGGEPQQQSHRPRRSKAPYPRSGPQFDRAVADCVLQLPPSLERLQRMIASLNMLYGFMLGQQVQMNWDNSCAALQAQLPSDNITLDDVILAASLVPEVLVTKFTSGSGAAAAPAAAARSGGQDQCSPPVNTAPADITMAAAGGHHDTTTCAGGESAAGTGEPCGGGSGAGGRGGGSLYMDLAAQGWRTDLAERAVLLDRLIPAGQEGCGTALYGSGTVSLELVDPGRASPLLYEDGAVQAGGAHHAAEHADGPLGSHHPDGCGGSQRGVCTGGSNGGGGGGGGAAGAAGGGGCGGRGEGADGRAEGPPAACTPRKVARRGGSRPEPVRLEDGRRLWFATNVNTRRLAAFRRGLVVLLEHLHSDFLDRLSPAERAGPPDPSTTTPQPNTATATTPTAAPTAAAAARAAAVAAAAAAAAVDAATAAAAVKAAAAAAGGAGGGGGGAASVASRPPWDPVARRAWHPLFQASLESDRFTPEQLRSAALEMRARRELLARNSGGGGGVGFGVRGGGAPRPGTAPRPPSLLKQYEPCVSCAALDPRGLLRHLQELPWYKGQVVHVEVLPARPAAYASPAAPLAPPVLRALDWLGIPGGRLYTHQADAVDALLGYTRVPQQQPPLQLQQSQAQLQPPSQSQSGAPPQLHLHPAVASAQREPQDDQDQQQHHHHQQQQHEQQQDHVEHEAKEGSEPMPERHQHHHQQQQQHEQQHQQQHQHHHHHHHHHHHEQQHQQQHHHHHEQQHQQQRDGMPSGNLDRIKGSAAGMDSSSGAGGSSSGGSAGSGGRDGDGGGVSASDVAGAVVRVPGRHVVVATATASGKSLCYLVPLLQALCEDPDACALMMFPTKALAQDQLRAIRGLLQAAFGGQHQGSGIGGCGFVPAAEVYDGDTPMSERPELRERAQVVLTNPDMLHATILPGHRAFRRLLTKLALVVVDEGHAYRGVFGAHTAMVLRRLGRLCAHVYGSRPRFVMTSATVANPAQLAATLLGVAPEEVMLVGPERDGSPSGLRRFALWNPPLTEEAQLAAGGAGAGAAMTRTEARKAARLSRNAERARYRQLMLEARTARARASQLAAARLTAGGGDGGGDGGGGEGVQDVQQEFRRLAAASRSLPQLKEALFGASPQRRRAAKEQLLQLQVADVVAAANAAVAATAAAAAAAGGASAGTGTAPALASPAAMAADNGEALKSAVKQEEEDDAVLMLEASEAMKPPGGGRALGQVGTAVAGSHPPKPSPVLRPVPLPDTREGGLARPAGASRAVARPPQPPLPDRTAAVAALAAQVRAALSAAVDLRPNGNGSGNSRSQMASLAPTNDVAAAPGSEVQQPRPRPLLIRTSRGAAAAAAAAAATSSAPSYDGGGAAAAADPRVVQELIARLPGPEWKEKHGAAGTPQEQRRDSPIVEMALLLAECVQHGLRTIAFCKSRKLCELVAAYTRETLAACAPDREGLVKVYRAGYSPSERRAMEADIHSGRLLALAATNALELGVDVGGLDVTLHLGFPGSVASLRQQAGRAGRREQESLSLVVGFDGPLDQHFMRHPGHLFGRPVEAVQVDVHNLEVMQQHLTCAAAEHPLLLQQDEPFFGLRVAEAVSGLLAAGLVARRPGGGAAAATTTAIGEWSGQQPQQPHHHIQDYQGSYGYHDHHHEGHVPYVYSGPKDSPAAGICLRAIDPDRFVIWDEASRMPLEEIEANMAFYEVYDGAVYLFQGRPYLCRQLNLGERVALVRPADVKYYTKVKDYTDVHVTGCHVAYPGPVPTAHRPRPADAAAAMTSGSQRASASASMSASAPVSTTQSANWVDMPSASAAYHPAAEHTVTAGTPTTASCEGALVVVRYLGYHRIWQGSNRLFDTVDLFLPDVVYDTQAAYVRVPPSARRECEERGLAFREGCHGANHALLNVVPLFLTANSNDLGTECDNPYDTRYRIERLLVYDKHRGGMGMAAAAAPLFPVLLERAHRRVLECDCPYAKGCPYCVQHLECRNYNAVLSKTGAEVVLRHVLEQERAHAAARRGSVIRGVGPDSGQYPGCGS